MYGLIAIFLAGFLFFVLMTARNYKQEIKEDLSRIAPEQRENAKKYILIKNLLFMLAPELFFFGMIVVLITGFDIENIFTETIVAFSIIIFLTIGISGVYSDKIKNLLPKEIQKVGAA